VENTHSKALQRGE